MEYAIGRKSRPVVVIPYQDRWPEEFRAVGTRLRQAVGSEALRIDHIGSTSVPGLSAKDIIDIQITIPSLDAFDEFRGRMEGSGFQMRMREQTQWDHQPLGDSGDMIEWRKRFFREPEGEKRTHIHVRESGRKNQVFPLLFRDYLRSHAEARGLYELIKYRLAELFPESIDAYLYIKDPAVDLIMMSATKWAAESGWKPGPSDA